MQIGRKLTATAGLLGAALCLPLAGCVDTAGQARLEPAAAPSKIARRPGPANILVTAAKLDGPLLVALDVDLVQDGALKTPPEKLFDRASLAVAENSDGQALFATDFQTDPGGFVRVLIVDRGLGAERAGALGLDQSVFGFGKKEGVGLADAIEVGRQNTPHHVRPSFSDVEEVLRALKQEAAA